MNIELLRRSLKSKWLDYYQDNRSWIARLSVWVSCDGTRRPSSSFILGTLTTLEPKLIELMPLIADLSNHPDRIVIALGLNFDPEQELTKLSASSSTLQEANQKFLPAGSRRPAEVDEACEGRGRTTP